MISLFLKPLLAVEYSLVARELIISGEGVIDRNGVNSKGSVSQVVNIIINEGPNEISNDSFNDCESLTTIFIPKSVSKIGQPFVQLNKIQKITVDGGNNNFCNDANFILYSKDKTRLIKVPSVANIPISDKVKSIDNYAFTSNHFNYGTVELPSTVDTLYVKSFWDVVFDKLSFKSISSLVSIQGFKYAKINTVVIPNSVTVIKQEAFQYATITNLLFESGSKLQSIEKCAFEYFKTKSIDLPESLLTIGEDAFKESTLVTISIGSKCSSISIKAFSGCKNLVNVVIATGNNFYESNEGVVMNKAHTQMIMLPKDIEKLTLPTTVTEIGQTMLQSASKLTEIILDGVGGIWSAEGGVLYSSDHTKLIAVCGGVTKVDAHISVQEVSPYAAFSCEKLTQFSFLGNSVNSIRNYAFAGSALTIFNFPNTVTTIGIHAFERMNSLTTFNLQSDSLIQEIPVYCFSSSALTSLNLSKEVTHIQQGAFFLCASLTELNFPVDSKLTFIGEYAFERTNIINIEIPSSVTTMIRRCFRFCSNLKTVTFKGKSTLTTITDVSFFQCTELWKVVLPDSCTTVESDAFKGCKKLSSFTHKLTTIGSGAFEDCISLQTFSFTDKQTSIHSGMFKNCYSLTNFNVDTGNALYCSINGIVYNKDGTKLHMFPPGQEVAKIPEEVLEFADNAFAWSPKLKHVAFYSGGNLETIGKAAFIECIHLKTIQFPAKLKTIKSQCFFGCTSIKTILFPPTLSTIESNAFKGCSMLKNVKYCGTKAVKGENVFEKSVVVSVTDMYPEEIKTFCNSPIARKLSFDCELKPEFLPTCRVANAYIPSSFIWLSLVMYCC